MFQIIIQDLIEIKDLFFWLKKTLNDHKLSNQYVNKLMLKYLPIKNKFSIHTNTNKSK
jgi:hypothetical protein